MRFIRLIGIAFLAIPIALSTIQNPLILEGEEVNFSWETSEALIKKASIAYEGLFFKSDTLSVEKGIMRLENASLTTCNLEHPHYKVFAKFIEIPLEGKKRKLFAKGASIFLGNRRLFSLPPFKVSLNTEERKKEDVISLPRVEFNKYTGFALTEKLAFNFRDELARLKIGYSTKKKLMGRLSLPVYSSLNFTLSRYEEILGKSISPLFLIEKPNISWQYKNSSISLGQFEEEPTKQEAKRFRIDVSQPLFKGAIGENISLELLGGGFYSLYSDGKRYRSLMGEMKLGKEGKYSQVNLYIGYSAIGGSTPFIFDREELTSYARLDLKKEEKNWIWELSGIWDFRNVKLYDAGITIYKKLHCLAPGISWQKRGGIFQLQMKILGFEM